MERSGTLEVDLGAVARNWARLRAIHAPGEVAAVLKADAYGLGAARVGPALRDAGCRTFFTATGDEGEALRDALGEGVRVAVLNGCRSPRLIPVLNTLAELRAHDGRDCFLHLDTGMHRLGLSARDVAELAADPAPLRRGVRLLMTHLVAAEDPTHPLNERQRARFAAACAALPALPRSVANSSGLFLGAGFRSDLARPGAALYGLNPTPGRPNPMEGVLRLSLPILQIRDVAAGEAVGYGAAWVAPRPSRIATVAGGYADGIARSWEGRGWGMLGGVRVPLAGRVSMDLLTFDVTDAPPGEAIEIMGPGHDADAFGAETGTIGYEVLCRLGARYRRRYTGA